VQQQNGIINIGTATTNTLPCGASTQVKLPGISSSTGSSLCRDSITNAIVICTAGSSSATLQSAYDQGNTILTSASRNIAFILANSSAFSIENQSATSAVIINDTSGATNTALDIQSNGSQH